MIASGSRANEESLLGRASKAIEAVQEPCLRRRLRNLDEFVPTDKHTNRC